jgi:hypothetical protein
MREKETMLFFLLVSLSFLSWGNYLLSLFNACTMRSSCSAPLGGLAVCDFSFHVCRRQLSSQGNVSRFPFCHLSLELLEIEGSHSDKNQIISK